MTTNMGLRAAFVKDVSFCDTNLYPDGPKTVEEIRARGRELCPHLSKCQQGGFIHPENHQCVMMNGAEVARNAVKEGHSVSEEMRDFRVAGLHPPGGWIVSLDRKTFSIISDGAEALNLVEHFAHIALLDGEEKSVPTEVNAVGPTFTDVVAHATDPETGTIDLNKMQKLEGRFGTNGGRGCDVLSGPCSCGAWH